MYSQAPYNFVPLPERVFARYQDESRIPGHDKFDKELNTGRITFEIEALSPLLIGKGKDKNNEIHFTQNNEGEYIIPGSSLRGLVRNNVQILGLGCVKDDIHDSLFLYRQLADQNKSLRDYYRHVVDISPEKTDEGNIKAGYIYKEKGEYYIKPAKVIGGHTYYSVNELNFVLYPERYQAPRDMNKMYRGFTVNHEENIETTIKKWKKDTEDKDNLNQDYKPYWVYDISFDLSISTESAPKIKCLSAGNRHQYHGCLLGSGKIAKKKCHYVINEMDDQTEAIPIDDKVVMYYDADLERTKKQRDLFYKLPTEEGVKKPIFYAQINGRLYLGFTPHLRIYYKHSIHQGLPESMREFTGIDYAMAMFGFTKEKVLAGHKEPISFKSRLRFMDGRCAVAKDSKIVKKVILGQPKATCCPDYLQQGDREKTNLSTYNDDDFKIRGVKQYWLKTKLWTQDISKVKNSKVITNMYPLDAGTKFSCEIFFSNLHDDELGLLLLALTLEKGCLQNIGMGKPLGFGKIKINNVRVYVDNFVKKYSTFTADYREERVAEEYIKAFESYLKSVNENDYKQYEAIKQDLLFIKSYEMTPEESRYMLLKEFSQRNRLKTISQYREEQEGNPAPPKMSGSSGKSEKQNGQALPDKQNKPRPYATKSQDNKTGKSAMELAMERARQNKDGRS